MIASKLIQTIKAHRGPIFVEVCNFNDCFWIQVVKSDLLAQLSPFEADAETGFELNADGCLGKDYSSQL